MDCEHDVARSLIQFRTKLMIDPTARLPHPLARISANGLWREVIRDTDQD
jgi:hypothetical protein